MLAGLLLINSPALASQSVIHKSGQLGVKGHASGSSTMCYLKSNFGVSIFIPILASQTLHFGTSAAQGG